MDLTSSANAKGRGRNRRVARSDAGSARRVLRVLSTFTVDAPQQTADSIAARLRLPQSSIYRYLSLLREADFIEEKERGVFALAPLVVQIASAARIGSGLAQVSLPFMRQLANESGETVILIRKSGDRAVCIERVESTSPIRMTFDVGTALPLHRGAAPKILLAYTQADEGKRLLQALLSLRQIKRQELRRLNEELGKIRQTGWAESHAEIKYDVYAVAAPIFDGKDVTAALSIVAPAYRVSKALRTRMCDLVRTAAREISAKVTGL